ncbi:hypothetical protein IJJ12_00905 [bacterium]|nr:hypothetical protein [bacterium]
MSNKRFWLLYTAIMVLALAIRLWGLGHVPTGLYWDEIAILADAKKIVATGTDLHELPIFKLIYPSYGDYKLAPYIWLATLSVQFFGPTAWALRLPSLLAGLATVALAGSLARLLSPTPARARIYQLTTMAVVALCPWSILFSRAGFEGHLGQMLLAASILCLLKYYQATPTKKHSFIHIFWLIASALLSGVSMWTYFSVRFVWPIVWTAVSLYFLSRDYRRWPTFLLNAAVSLGIFGLMMLAMLRDPLYAASNQLRLSTPSILNNNQLIHQVNYQRLLAGNTLPARILFTHKGAQAVWLARNLSQHVSGDFLFLHGDANLRHSTGFVGLFYLIWAPFLLIGLVSLYRHDWRLCLVLLAWWAVALVPASVPVTDVPHALRTLNALVPACLLIAWGIAIFLNRYILLKPSQIHLSTKQKILAFFLIAAQLFATGRFLWHYWHVYPALSAASWQTASTRHAEILAAQKDHFAQLHAVGIGQLTYLWYLVRPEFDPSSLARQPKDSYQFTQLDNIYFGNQPLPLRQEFFLLTTQDTWERLHHEHTFLQENILYDYVQDGEHYLGAAVILGN